MRNRLDHAEATRLALRRLRGETFVSIARDLGVSPSTASRAFHRAAAELKACVGCGQGWPGPNGEPPRGDHESQCPRTYLKT